MFCFKRGNSRLRKSSAIRSVNRPISVGIELVSSIPSITIYKVESQRNKVRSMDLIIFASMHDKKTENSCLPNLRLVSSVNEPTSVGIDPVR